MRYLLGCLWLTSFLPAFALSPVAVEKEPRHHLTFSNPSVRVFHVFIPPGDSSLVHTHLYDGLSVRLSDATVRDEAVGGASEDVAVKRGAVTFGYRPAPLSHSVSNIGSTPFRNIFVEVLPSAGAAPEGVPQDLVAGQTLVLENERVRVSRLVLAPGDSIEMHTHGLRSFGIAVSEGTIAVEVAGRKLRRARIKPGDMQWHDGGTRHSLKNIGSAPYEAVEIELK